MSVSLVIGSIGLTVEVTDDETDREFSRFF